jgi:hypothetical protein
MIYKLKSLVFRPILNMGGKNATIDGGDFECGLFVYVLQDLGKLISRILEINKLFIY